MRPNPTDRPTGTQTAEASEVARGISAVRRFEALEALVPEWTQLYYESGVRNPFAHPGWMMTWARHCVAPDQLYIVTMRSDTGALIGLAPFYRFRRRLAPCLSVIQLRLLGTGQLAQLTELPQILTCADAKRKVLRDIVGFICTTEHDWDWLEIALTPDQGWFEPQWLPVETARAGGFVIHKDLRACVVLPLTPTWEELRTGFKRNVKESIRRGANRLSREGRQSGIITPPDGVSLDTALDELARLHRTRAEMQGKVRHADYLNYPRDRAFIYDVAHRMFSVGHLTPYLLQVDGATVAARLVLHANRTTYFSLSGFDPAWWDYNVATTLTAECLREAMSRGDVLANLSIGPDVAKLRWSEQLEVHHDFLVVAPRRRSRLAFSVFWQLHAVAQVRREQRMYRDM